MHRCIAKGGMSPCVLMPAIVLCDVHMSFRDGVFKHFKVPDCGWSWGLFRQQPQVPFWPGKVFGGFACRSSF